MGFMSELKAAGEILKEAGKSDLYLQLIESGEKLLELKEENGLLKDKIKTLTEKLEIKDSLVFEDIAYWMKDEEGKIKRGPFCSLCYDSDAKLIHLISCSDPKYSMCPKCKKVLPIKYGKAWRDQQINQEPTPDDDRF